MTTESLFLNHLRHAEETIRNWPSWKRNMWHEKENEKDSQNLDARTKYAANLFYGQKYKSK